MTALRTLLALLFAAGVLLLVKKVLVVTNVTQWNRAGILQIELLLIAIVAGSIVATEIVHLSQVLLSDSQQPGNAHAIGWRDVRLLLGSMFASFLIVVTIFWVSEYLGVPPAQ